MSLTSGTTESFLEESRSSKPSFKPSSKPIDLSKAPTSSLAFDWVYTILVFLLSAGIFLDGWSHSEYGPDQSVFSEYHLLFYTSLAVIGVWLFGSAYLNRRDGFSGLKALPAGYALSALGVFIFGITGMFDLVGHKLYGFEVDFEALFSPSHTGLFAGWALIAVGPARAAVFRRQRQLQISSTKIEPKTSWFKSMRQLMPALIAWTSFANVMSFVGMNFFATTNLWMISNYRRGGSGSMDYAAQMLGILGIMFETAIVIGCLIWLLNRFKLPIGSIFFFFAFIGSFAAIPGDSFDMVPIYLVTGVLAEVLYIFLRPGLNRQAQLHIFNFCLGLSMWLIFYGFIILTNFEGGTWYTPYIWTGSIAYGGITALLISLLSTSSSGAAHDISSSISNRISEQEVLS